MLTRTAHLRQSFRRLRLLTLIRAGAGIVLLGLLLGKLPNTQSSILLSLLLLTYLTQKVRRFYRGHKALKQLRLEEHFIRHSLKTDHLQQCLTHQEHLWTHSYIVRGLRAALRRLSPPVRSYGSMLETEFHRAFQRLRPSRLSLDLLLIAGAGGLLLLSAAPLARSWTFLLGILLLVELGHAPLRWRLYGEFLHFERALADWILSGTLETVLHPTEAKRYHTTTLYYAQPWFATSVAPPPTDLSPKQGDSLPAPSEIDFGF